jgi:AcrR family transcriptional regulator
MAARRVSNGRLGKVAGGLALAEVIATLKRAGERGELSQGAVDWSIGRLAARAPRGNARTAGVDRSDDILKAATQVFARRGYHHATIEEVAKELQLTKAGVYHYFGSKQEILDAIVERAMTSAEQALADGIAGGGRPVDKLRLALRNYGIVLLRDGGLSIFIRHFDELSEEMQQSLQKRRKRVEKSLRQVLEAGIAAGELNLQDPQVAVFGMYGTINWAFSWFEPNGRLSVNQVVDNLVDQIIEGVLAR